MSNNHYGRKETICPSDTAGARERVGNLVAASLTENKKASHFNFRLHPSKHHLQ
ncbi:hypothetical protein [Pontibacter pudoricolor]|uniref:hypothetical protein n=1 Tax=Pontibacter pudoricolor TaxID=2694930 RepID=UPI00139191DE|nr:hypothetical protein [Pontibacter pudoricolor]